MKLCAFIAGALLCLSLAHAETTPPPGPVDPRVRVIAYNPDDVIRLHGYVGYQIHMQWADGEEFVNLGAGDVGGLDVGAEKNHFFLKPKQEKVETNLTVLTNLRTYHFDYSVGKAPANPLLARDMVYSLRFTYPREDAKRAAADAERRRADAALNQATADRPRNLAYAYCGTPALKPIAAFDDGVHTHLRFAARGEFPAIFVRNDDGSESLINFNVEQDEVVVHRVAKRFVLRRGQLVGCIINQAFEGGGERLPSNTTVSNVTHETKGLAP
ncbi:MAG: TrbG/VirB9 family P-type conjugative transfer protein [Proteobacteria bacterium]|nr:TrbG/VirB9 family P-type conjugative transfer protein [Pseudomonadota bacterium]